MPPGPLAQKARDLTAISNQVDRHTGHRCQWKISFEQEETEIFESEEMKSPSVLRSLCFLLFKSFQFLGSKISNQKSSIK